MKKTLILTLMMMAGSLMAQPRWGWDPNRTETGPDVHDPVMARGEDGRYYIFSTGMGVNVLSSADRKEWKHERHAMRDIPQWALDSIRGYRGHTWAPDISQHDGLWWLYYSCSTFGKNGSAIGLMTNKTLDPTSPDFEWQDRGMVIASHRHRDCYNCIDPNLIVDRDNRAWLVFGSFWDGIQLVELDRKDLQIPLTQPRTIARRYAHRYTLGEIDHPQFYTIEGKDTIEAADNAIEAPFIIARGDWYYLFVSQDYCCRGQRSTYRTVYGRSKNVEGPYVDRDGVKMEDGGGTLLYGPDADYFGIGHCGVYDWDGHWWFISHAYTKADDGRAKLFQRELKFDKKGWIK